MNNIENAASKGKCFISHCTDDKDIMNNLVDLIKSMYKCDITRENPLFFCTYHNSFNAATRLDEELVSVLNDCSYMIAIVTDSYLRSPIALFEFCSFYASNKPIIPIVFNDEVGNKFIDSICSSHYMRINVSKNSTLDDIAAVILKSFNEFSPINKQRYKRNVKNFLNKSFQAKAQRNYIGCEESLYKNVICQCRDMGITKIRTENDNEALHRLSECESLYIVSTTGGGLIRALCDKGIMSNILLNEGTVTVLIPNKESDFCHDVAEIENPYNYEKNRIRLNNEYKGVIYLLNECLTNIRKTYPDKPIGKIYVGSAYTLLRQTITLGICKDKVYGFVSMTIPPFRTADGTPTLDFYSDNVDRTMGNLLYKHVTKIRDIAQSRNNLYEIDTKSYFENGFYLEKTTAREYWTKKYDEARDNMREHSFFSDVLIEVAAQHPLIKGTKPGEEFSARLDCAVELYNKYKQGGTTVKVYIPGSRHRYKNQEDTISLSSAGRNYLIDNGVDENDIMSDDVNERYKAEEGVYNSADECFVASAIFMDGNYRNLCCICSPNQMMRKKLFYLEMGILPFFYTVSTENMFHSDIGEIFEVIPDVIYNDHSWQDKNSVHYKRTRDERMPKK